MLYTSTIIFVIRFADNNVVVHKSITIFNARKYQSKLFVQENRAPENKHESNSAGRNLNSLLTNSKRARLLSFLNAQPRNIGRQTKVRKKGHKSLVGSFKFDRFILSSPTLIKYPVQKSEALLLNGILHKQGDLSSESLAGKQPESTTSVTSFRRTSKRGNNFHYFNFQLLLISICNKYKSEIILLVPDG